MTEQFFDVQKREFFSKPILAAIDLMEKKYAWNDWDVWGSDLRRMTMTLNLPIERNYFDLSQTHFVIAEVDDIDLPSYERSCDYVVICDGPRQWNDENVDWALEQAEFVWERETGSVFPGVDEVEDIDPVEFVPGRFFRPMVPLTDDEMNIIDNVNYHLYGILTLPIMSLLVDGFGWRPGMALKGQWPDTQQIMYALMTSEDVHESAKMVEGFLMNRYPNSPTDELVLH